MFPLLLGTQVYIYYLVISRVDTFQMEPIIFTIKSYIIAVFNSVYSPLWFIRTLVVYTLVSPIIIFIWKNRYIAVIMIIVLIMSNYWISTSIISDYYLPIYLIGAFMGLYYPNEIIKEGKLKKKIIGYTGIFLVIIIAFLVADKRLTEIWLFTMRLIGGLSFWLFFDIFRFDKPQK